MKTCYSMSRKNRSWDFNIGTRRLEEYDYDLQKYVFCMVTRAYSKSAAVREYKKEELRRAEYESCREE